MLISLRSTCSLVLCNAQATCTSQLYSYLITNLTKIYLNLLASLTTRKKISKLTMPKALILIADGSEEIEFVTPYDGKSLTGLIRRARIA